MIKQSAQVGWLAGGKYFVCDAGYRELNSCISGRVLSVQASRWTGGQWESFSMSSSSAVFRSTETHRKSYFLSSLTVYAPACKTIQTRDARSV